MQRDDNKNGEQPDVKLGLTVDSNEENSQDKRLGSPLGKFKTADDLLDAYNNLEAEFTKKCQKLSEMQRESSRKDDNVSQKDEIANDATSLEQVIEEKSGEEKLEPQSKTPFYLSSDWQDRVEEFVKTHKYASNVMTELADELMKDSNLSCNADCLELAYNKILAKRFKSEKELLNSEDFISKILENDDIKMKIISDYISKLDRQKTPPVISQTKGSYTNLASNKKVSTLSEAKQLAELLFNY